jgi:hypothetical protein
MLADSELLADSLGMYVSNCRFLGLFVVLTINIVVTNTL